MNGDEISEGKEEEKKWGPTHSDDETEDSLTLHSSRFFGSRSKARDGDGTSFLGALSFFACGGTLQTRTNEEEEDLETDDDQGPGCQWPFFTCGRSQIHNEDQTKTTISASEEDITLKDPSLISLKKTKRPWSSPPQLYKIGLSALRKDDVFRNRPGHASLVDEVVYLSELETFLSDDLTEIEQSYLNGLYEKICKPCTGGGKRRTQSSSATVSRGGTKSDVLSFDDTVSKLTLEDAKSLSTISLNTLEHLTKKSVDRASIAAIVNAQERGAWRTMVKEEAEAKADELARFGIEYTLDAMDAMEFQPPSESIILVHLVEQPAQERDDDEQKWEDIRPLFPSARSLEADGRAEVAQTDCPGSRLTKINLEERETKDNAATQHMKTRFLTAFKRGRKKEGKDNSSNKAVKGSKQRRRWMMRPPSSKSKQNSLAPSPTASTVARSVSVDGTNDQADRGDDVDEIQFHGKSSPGRLANPVVFEEVEVLSKRKEPVYTAYIRTQSNNLVQDVEVLRQESALSEDSAIQFEDDSENYLKDEVVMFPPWKPIEGTHFDVPECVPESGDLRDEGGSACDAALGPPSLTAISSRLAEENDRMEQLSLMLKKKDADLVELKELLRVNESSVVMERLQSISLE